MPLNIPAFGGTIAADAAYSAVSDGNQHDNSKSNSRKQSSKAIDSELKRQNSIFRQEAEFKNRQKALSSGLSASLTGSGSKKLKFASSSDSDNDERRGKSLRNGASATKKTKKKSSASSKIPSPTKQKLFDDESNSDGGNSDQNINFDKPHFKGKSGEKLRALESSYGGDSRFKIDSRFAPKQSSKQKKSSVDVPLTEEMQQTRDLQVERDKARQVLEGVLGKSIPNKSYDGGKKSKGKERYLGKMTRFDPTNPAHYQFEKTKKADSDKSSDSSDGEESEVSKEAKSNQGSDASDDSDSDKSEVSKPTKKNSSTKSAGNIDDEEEGESKSDQQNFYHMDKSFADKLRQRLKGNVDGKKNDDAKTTEEPFSLLKSLNLQPELEGDLLAGTKIMGTAEPILSKKKQKLLGLMGKTDETNDIPSSISHLNSNFPAKNAAHNKSGSLRVEPFFFVPDDKRLRQAIKQFRRTQNVDVIRKKWTKFRPMLVNSYKRQRKEALKGRKTGRQFKNIGKKGRNLKNDKNK